MPLEQSDRQARLFVQSLAKAVSRDSLCPIRHLQMPVWEKIGMGHIGRLNVQEAASGAA